MTRSKTLHERAFELADKRVGDVNAPEFYAAGFSHGFRDGWLAGYHAAKRDKRRGK